jgi:hypothetical protein
MSKAIYLDELKNNRKFTEAMISTGGKDLQKAMRANPELRKTMIIEANKTLGRLGVPKFEQSDIEFIGQNLKSKSISYLESLRAIFVTGEVKKLNSKASFSDVGHFSVVTLMVLTYTIVATVYLNMLWSTIYRLVTKKRDRIDTIGIQTGTLVFTVLAASFSSYSIFYKFWK